MSLINETYFKSRNVKVYPTAFRGNYTASGDRKLQFDPESRLPSEYNIIRSGGAIGLNKSYIISWEPINSTTPTEGKLTCVIGGYYFEIEDIHLEDFHVDDVGEHLVKNLYIKTREIELTNGEINNIATEDSTRKTKVLAGFINEGVLDEHIIDNSPNGNGETWTFTGIYVSAIAPNDAAASLTPITLDKNNNPVINYSAILPNIHSGSGITATNNGNVVSSIKLGTDTEALNSDTLAIGKNTTAYGKTSLSVGDTTIAYGQNSIAAGEGKEINTIISEVDNKKITINYSDKELKAGQLLKWLDADNHCYYFTVKNSSLNNTAQIVTLNDSDDLGILVPNRPIYIVTEVAYGQDSFVAGIDNLASGKASIAIGKETVANGENSHTEGNLTNASGAGAHAEGYSTIAKGDYSHTEGGQTEATKSYSHAEGSSNIASGEASHAEGYKTKATGNYSHAEGVGNKNTYGIASGIGSHAEGYYNKATKDYSHAEGKNNIASGIGAHAEGSQTKAYGESSHAEGFTTITGDQNNVEKGKYAHAEGEYTIASGEASHAEGYGLKIATIIASGTGAHAEGYNTIASGDYSHAEGNMTNATQNAAHTEGIRTNASGAGTHAEGYTTIASGRYSHTEGIHTEASGEGSHTEGYLTVATKNYAHAEGCYTKASGEASHAEGYGASNNLVEASEKGAHAEGRETKAVAEGAHAEGHQTQAGDNTSTVTKLNSTYSHAEGQSTKALGFASHAEGYGTEASGRYSHTEGQNTKATNMSDHAEGTSTKASGASSHAEGNSTKASGEASHAEGMLTEASGEASHANGKFTVADGTASFTTGIGTYAKNEAEVAIGKYNTNNTNKRAFVIGNGTSDNIRKDAFEVLVDQGNNGLKYKDNNNEIQTADVMVNIAGQPLTKFILATLLDSIYPVGSIFTATIPAGETWEHLDYGYENGLPICPIKKKLGGTWKYIQGTFLYAAEVTKGTLGEGSADTTNFGIGKFGGRKDWELIKHNHGGFTGDTSPETSNASPSNSNGRNGDLQGDCWFIEAEDDSELIEDCHGMITAPRAARKSGTDKYLDQSGKGGDGFRFNIDARHTHTVNPHKHSIDSSGTVTNSTSSLAKQNMPPYTCVYMWKRIG